MYKDYDYIRNQVIGSVEFVSPNEIRVVLEINAPQNTAINTGTPQIFPKINGFLLIPSEAGSIIGMISWMGIEYSSYPKRKGYKDFDIIDLPFPLKKLSLTPLGMLKKYKNENYEIERGICSYPTVGDPVLIPDDIQLKAIVENKDKRAKIQIGTSPLAGNAPVFINPDKLFGRHIAVLGNTGSGKSCSVAGLIRWSIEEAYKETRDSLHEEKCNSRFIILDPNGEYTNTFDGLGKIKKFQVKLNIEDDPGIEKLKVPAWMWNSYEWSAISQASDRSQRPLLRRALREVRGNYEPIADIKIKMRRFYSSWFIEISNDLRIGVSVFEAKPGRNEFGRKLQNIKKDIEMDQNNLSDESIKANLKIFNDILSDIIIKNYKTFTNDQGKNIEYFESFLKNDVESIIKALSDFILSLGGMIYYEGPDEDTPVYFNNQEFLNHIERLASEGNLAPFMDFFLMRLRSILTDSRIVSVIETSNKDEIPLSVWLDSYIYKGDELKGEITIIDLSLVPSEILLIIISVLSRIIFEAHQRYRRLNGKALPTTLVVEEAHNFIKRYDWNSEEISPSRLCSQSFEKIAKEGRKFGLGLIISSQRPSELSPTVLSQCNTFLLHRIVNDIDQEMVKKLIPDNLGSVLKELPNLPTRKAILLGYATPIPLVVDMNLLKLEHRPSSKDPEYWDVWTGKEERIINWDKISLNWQNEKEHS